MVGRDQYGYIKGPYYMVKPGPMPSGEHNKVESKKLHKLGRFPKRRRTRCWKSLLRVRVIVGSKMESNDVAKAAMNEIWGILFSLISMAGMAEPFRCKG